MTIDQTHPHRSAKERAEERLRLWRGRGLLSIGAFLLGCAAVSVFLDGHPLHRYWESFGKYLIFLCMALLLVLLYCVGLWWAAWRSAK